jgi:hypothetical protein
MIKIGHAAIGTNRQTKRSVASLATRKRGGNPEWTQKYVPIFPDAFMLPCIEVFSSTWQSNSQILTEMRAKLKTPGPISPRSLAHTNMDNDHIAGA